MVVISYSGKEANAKIVYYGPGLGGKTTNLEFIYDSVPASSRGKLVSMKTQTDRTLFFDFLPLDLGELGGFKTRFLLYTVPGQVFYNATRKLVLRGVDAVAFIADSQVGKMDENKESLANLVENLAEYDLTLDNIPWVIQYNKRDIPDAHSIEELNRELNPENVPYFEAVATEGIGVFETFRGLSRLLLEKLSDEIGHRMVVGRSLGREAESAQPQVEHAESTPHVEPSTPRAEDALITDSPPPSVPSHDVSEVDLEELEIVPEDRAVEPETISELEPVSQPEAALEPEPVLELERPVEPKLPSDLELAKEEGVFQGFFGELVRSAPLEKEIVHEEVILSKESDFEAPGHSQMNLSRESGAEMLTAERAPAPAIEKIVETEKIPESADATEPAEATEPVEERPAAEEHLEEPTGEESFFRQMVRRNHTAIFGEQHEEAPLAESPCTKAEPVSDVKSLEQVIEIPASMLRREEGKEIVLTLRIRVTREPQETRSPSDEFLLDGISR